MPRVLFAILAAGAAAVSVRAQQSPTFVAGTRAVALYATVVDPLGRVVPNLSRDDFEVSDNGKRQTLTNFSNDVQPITAVMMLDRSGTSARTWKVERDATQAFVDALLPADRLRLGSFATDVRLEPAAFTSDRERLSGILQATRLEAARTPLWDAAAAAIDALAGESGRRVMFIFTDGEDSPGDEPETATYAEVERRAADREVMVYGVGIAFACGPGDRATFDPNQPDQSVTRRVGGRNTGGEKGRGGPGGGASPCLVLRPDRGLKTLSAPFGGTYLELKGTEDLRQMFAGLADDLHHQYLLGFTTHTLDGKVHKLSVKVRRSDLSVRARASYVATPDAR
jgi:VWFA-related protein